MAKNFNKQSLKLFTILFFVWIYLTDAFPLPSPSDDNIEHNGNYEMIVMDDHEPAESMHFQNFDEFFNAEMKGNVMSEMEMAESRTSADIRAPQEVNARERSLREHLEDFDVQREKHNKKLLTKGSTMPQKDALDWDQFDYEMFVHHH